MVLFTCLNNANAQQITIGAQTWASANLNVTTFRNGDAIPEAKTWEAWDKAEPAWCYYENDPANGEKYGRLYNWYAVIDPRGLAPKGWHVPSNDEWKILIDLLGGVNAAYTKMKSTNGWARDSVGSNESGFGSLPGGSCNSAQSFGGIGYASKWWSSTEYSSSTAWYLVISGTIYNSDDDKLSGLSVRCLKDR